MSYEELLKWELELAEAKIVKLRYLLDRASELIALYQLKDWCVRCQRRPS